MDLRSIIDSLSPYEKTFADTPRVSIRPASNPSSYATALQSLRQRRSTSAALVYGNLLGEGGMGTVHLAEQSSVGRAVAVKQIRQDMAADSNSAKALLREGWVLAALEHPNIPPVYDVMLDENDAPLILLKNIQGENWAQLMRDPSTVQKRYGESLLSWNLGVLDKVCNALSYAHSKRIVHRDIKPDNVMIGAFGEVYLLDWGIAAALYKDPAGRLPHIGEGTQPAGTPCFMAPELLFEDASDVGEHTDVYLLGASLYEVLVGKPPHSGKTMKEIVASIMKSNPIFPDDLPAALVEICRKAMSFAPGARYSSVDQMQLALRHFQQRRASQQLTEEASERLARLRELTALPESEATEMARLFSECRFGYRQALALATDEEEAIAGLAAATELMARHALTGGKIDAARSFLDELQEPDPVLLREIDEAAAAQDERARELAAQEAALLLLRETEREIDIRIGQRARGFVLFAVGFFWCGGMLLLGSLQRASHFRMTCERLFLGEFVIFVALTIAALLAPKVLLKNKASRAVVIGLFAVVVGCLAVFAFAIVLPLGVPEALALAHVVMWVAVMTATPYDARFLIGDLLLPIGLVIPWVPDFALEVNGIVVILTLWGIAWSMRGAEPEAQ